MHVKSTGHIGSRQITPPGAGKCNRCTYWSQGRKFVLWVHMHVKSKSVYCILQECLARKDSYAYTYPGVWVICLCKLHDASHMVVFCRYMQNAHYAYYSIFCYRAAIANVLCRFYVQRSAWDHARRPVPGSLLLQEQADTSRVSACTCV